MSFEENTDVAIMYNFIKLDLLLFIPDLLFRLSEYAMCWANNPDNNNNKVKNKSGLEINSF